MSLVTGVSPAAEGVAIQSAVTLGSSVRQVASVTPGPCRTHGHHADLASGRDAASGRPPALEEEKKNLL